MLYFVSHGASTNVKNEKNGYMIRTKEPTADYIPKELLQLIVVVKYVWRKEEPRMSKAY
jgi:hypothetical protein